MCHIGRKEIIFRPPKKETSCLHFYLQGKYPHKNASKVIFQSMKEFVNIRSALNKRLFRGSREENGCRQKGRSTRKTQVHQRTTSERQLCAQRQPTAVLLPSATLNGRRQSQHKVSKGRGSRRWCTSGVHRKPRTATESDSCKDRVPKNRPDTRRLAHNVDI